MRYGSSTDSKSIHTITEPMIFLIGRCSLIACICPQRPDAIMENRFLDRLDALRRSVPYMRVKRLSVHECGVDDLSSKIHKIRFSKSVNIAGPRGPDAFSVLETVPKFVSSDL